MQVSSFNKNCHFQTKSKTDVHVNSDISFKQNVDTRDVQIGSNDSFNPSSCLISLVELNHFQGLKSVTFKKPVHVSQALDSFIQSEYLTDKFLEQLHTVEDLTRFREDLKNNEKLKNTKIKKLYALGNFALAFETTDEKILKISKFDHFKGRKPAFFDLPVLKQGISGDTYYYLEEKVSQDNISQEELRDFVKEIKSRGYKMKDYLLHYTPNEDESDATIKPHQFGKTKDGRLYLIDPGCVLERPKHFFNPKTIKDRFVDFFKKN